MANPNPKNKFQKGDKRAGRPAGVTNVMSKDIKILLREAAEEVGFIQKVRASIYAPRATPAAEIGAPFSIPLRLGGRGRSLSVIRE